MELHEKLQKCHELLATFVSVPKTEDTESDKSRNDALVTELKTLAAPGKASLMGIIATHADKFRTNLAAVKSIPTSTESGKVVLIEAAVRAVLSNLQGTFNLFATIAGRVVDDTVTEDDLGALNGLATVHESFNDITAQMTEQAAVLISYMTSKS